MNRPTFAAVERSRVDNSGRFKAFTEPRHRLVAAVLTGVLTGVPRSLAAQTVAANARRGAIVVYPTYPFARDEPDWPEVPAIGFALLPPGNHQPRRAVFGVLDEKRKSEAVI